MLKSFQTVLVDQRELRPTLHKEPVYNEVGVIRAKTRFTRHFKYKPLSQI
jgi:hypothetical protein